MTRVLVLGGTGMLGSMMVKVLTEMNMKVSASARLWMPVIGWFKWYAEDFVSSSTLPPQFDTADWIINCIGITKPCINENDPTNTARAIQINSLFPYKLAGALRPDQRMIQIATDCVFSGKTDDRYYEDSPHDALDVYGKTKSLGEVVFPNVMHLRTSIIGPEPRATKRFLLEWLLEQPKDAIVNGFTDHLWNGVTTLQFARICAGIIGHPGLFEPGVHHLLPGNSDSKWGLLQTALAVFDRGDVQLRQSTSGIGGRVMRLLGTREPMANLKLWKSAGYSEPLLIREMLTELAAYK